MPMVRYDGHSPVSVSQLQKSDFNAEERRSREGKNWLDQSAVIHSNLKCPRRPLSPSASLLLTLKNQLS
jgi:hypothetical protein